MHPLLCSSVLGPRAALRSCTEFPSGGVVRSQSGAASEQKTIIPALRDRIPIDRKPIDRIPISPRRRVAKISGTRGRRLNNSTLKYADRTLPINRNDSAGTDPTKSSRSADLAFQRAMRCAIAQGLEHPPMVGIVKDIRPLITPRLFEPVPHSSGCTSPACDCAELMAHND
jgi:hypothetical protein